MLHNISFIQLHCLWSQQWETLEAIAVTAIMVRQRITDQAITTDVAIETIIITTIVIAIESIMVLTDVSNATHLVIATDHIGYGRYGCR